MYSRSVTDNRQALGGARQAHTGGGRPRDSPYVALDVNVSTTAEDDFDAGLPTLLHGEMQQRQTILEKGFKEKRYLCDIICMHVCVLWGRCHFLPHRVPVVDVHLAPVRPQGVDHFRVTSLYRKHQCIVVVLERNACMSYYHCQKEKNDLI